MLFGIRYIVVKEWVGNIWFVGYIVLIIGKVGCQGFNKGIFFVEGVNQERDVMGYIKVVLLGGVFYKVCYWFEVFIFFGIKVFVEVFICIFGVQYIGFGVEIVQVFFCMVFQQVGIGCFVQSFSQLGECLV